MLSRVGHQKIEWVQAEKARDDVLPKIMASSEGHAELFARELSKYNALKADIAGAKHKIVGSLS